MKTERIDTLILGTGPSGLAAGYQLARAGHRPILLEKDQAAGGLMRSIHRGDFVVDVGRKELYNRLAPVDEFWGGVLGADYREYPHRGGILYDGRIIELTPGPRGLMRGMPVGWFAQCALGLLLAQVPLGRSQPRNLEQYFYSKRGRKLTQIASQGFQEKLTGKKWADIPLPADLPATNNGGALATLKAALTRAFVKQEVNNFKGRWRHPARGTGQICDALAQGITAAGGSFRFGARLLETTAAEARVTSVTAEVAGEKINFAAENVVSSIPLEFLGNLLLPGKYEPAKLSPALDSMRKTVVLVYHFLDEPPRFPHAWLQVTCPNTRSGRIANYTGFNGDMVPPGKSCLCCEYYLFGKDPLIGMPDADWIKLSADECARAGLLDPARTIDNLVLRLPGADASQNRHNWMSPPRVALMQDLQKFRNLYFVNRTDLDIATLAGLEAAAAILSGQRATFDAHIDPEQIGIRSIGKAFEFRSPIKETV